MNNKITYRKEGDYLIPNLYIKNYKKSDYSIGKYGRLRLNYLKEHNRVLYTELLLDGKLSKHLALIDEDANKEEEQKHSMNFEDIAKNILRNVPEQNKKYVKKQIDLLDENYLDYIFYWDEKYYRNGFCDAVELVSGCFN